MLSGRSLSLAYHGRQVLHGVHVAARPGQVTCILGPNGSGKSSLLAVLAGDVPGAGTVTLNGRDIATMPAWHLASLRAVLPQACALAFAFTVAEVVAMGLQRSAGGQSAQVTAEALSRVGLSSYRDRPYPELSGGEQQRVQIARVLAQVWQPVGPDGPRWLLLDEPVSALDIAHQVQVMQLARQFARAGGGVVAVMHDLNLTAHYADHLLLLSGGRVLGEGRPAKVMSDAVLSRAYACDLKVGQVPPADIPFVLPTPATAGDVGT